MKRWRYETRPGGTGANATARWGPWAKIVEVHQAQGTLVTDATVTNRIMFLRHSMPAEGIILGEFPSAAIVANVGRGAVTWFQGAQALNVQTNAAPDEFVLTTPLPFAFFINVGQVLDLLIGNLQAGDTLAAPIIMVRDVDEIGIAH